MTDEVKTHNTTTFLAHSVGNKHAVKLLYRFTI